MPIARLARTASLSVELPDPGAAGASNSADPTFTTLPLAEAMAAHELMESSAHVGKIMLQVHGGAD